jgi:hypothetical protein
MAKPSRPNQGGFFGPTGQGSVKVRYVIFKVLNRKTVVYYE